MDITVGPLVNLWGFGPDKQPVKTPTQAQIDAAKARTGLAFLSVINRSGRQYLQKSIPDLYVDLSTVGEGYAADHLARLMTEEGISRYLVSVGGALVSRGMNAEDSLGEWRYKSPRTGKTRCRPSLILTATGLVHPAAIVTTTSSTASGSHTLSTPQTGRPITHKLVSVTVIAPTALEADGWDTGLMVLGPQKAQQVVREYGLAVYMIMKDGDGFTTWMSPQFKTFLVGGKN
ncbi:Thiamine biosynthesis lipoprotein ApbE precursor [Kluyvera cryocrescens]|uniref:FAD:protein FMN transferase n=1 Tax=Kluyvera cryocrescens TaxID=580 RepID=A0A485C274_KLUCR|nr:Thiamine biosynthesis lipoprotein ApbE precursor [Kluyvera cryocrescens]